MSLQLGGISLILKKVTIKSFGKLRSLDIDFGPGLNIVYGENESGKSTIQSFIKGVFYGLRKKSRKDEISEYEKYEPWDIDEFAGMIEYEVDGKKYKAARNFATNKASVYNEFWDEVTDEFEMDKKLGTLFAEKHIGMNEDTFERTIFIRQLESRINESKDISDKLLNIQQTGLEETSFRGAIETLEGIMKEKIGSDKTLKKPINLISNDIERLLKEKYEVNLLRKEVAELEEKIKQKDQEKKELLWKIEQLKNTKQSLKKEKLLEQYNKAKEYETSLEITQNEILRIQIYENFPVQLEGNLKEVLNNIRNLKQIIEGKREYLKGIETKIQLSENQNGVNLKLVVNSQSDGKVDFSFEDMDQALIKYRAFSEYKEKVTLTQCEIEKFKQDILENNTALFDLSGFANLSEDIEEQVMKLYDKSNSATVDSRYELDTLNNKGKVFKYKLITNTLLTIISLGLIGYGIFGIVALCGVIPIVIGGIGIFILVFSVIKLIEALNGISKINKEKNEKAQFKLQEKDSTQYIEELDEIYKGVSARDFTSFMKKFYSYKDVANKAKLLNLDLDLKTQYLESIKDQMGNIQKDISQVLNFLGVVHDTNDISDINILNLKEKLSMALKKTSEVSNLKELKESISSDIIETEEELKGAFNEKDAILEEAMVHCEDEFFEGCKNRLKVRLLLDEKARLLNILDELLQGEDSESLLQKVSAIPSKDIYTGEIESLEYVDTQIEDFKRELDMVNEDLINFKNSAANKLNGKPELNEIVEKLEYLQGKKNELENSKHSLEVAIDVLKETTMQIQRDFAPRLQNEISNVIKQITAGKYFEVKANEKLNLNVIDPGVGKIISIEKLSMGTIDQFYLALRIALSNVLGEGSEKVPLIIDEAFVQYDDIRMLNVLEFLLEISKFRQIIIFTCQSREVEAIKRIGTDDVKVIELSTD